jgi:HK97 gp10 family phage protein
MFNVVVTGMEYLRAKLTKANRTVYDKSTRQVENSARRIVARAKSLAPVGTGQLRGSIDYVMRGSKALIGVQGAPAHYWYFVEFGTKRTAARPFFRPASEAEKGPFTNGMIGIGRDLENV